MEAYSKFRKEKIIDSMGVLFVLLFFFLGFLYFNSLSRFISIIFVITFTVYGCYLYKLLFCWEEIVVTEDVICKEIYGLRSNKPRKQTQVICWKSVKEIELMPNAYNGVIRSWSINVKYRTNRDCRDEFGNISNAYISENRIVEKLSEIARNRGVLIKIHQL